MLKIIAENTCKLAFQVWVCKLYRDGVISEEEAKDLINSRHGKIVWK